MTKHKRIGHCSCCEEFLWEPASNRLSWPGVRATTMLADGSIMDLTLCDACSQKPDLGKMWTNVILGWQAEDAVDYAMKQARDNFIVCVLYTMPWNMVEN